ncbi:aminoglycoside phosphotransferase family protein [Bradyrhizobium cenepequi]
MRSSDVQFASLKMAPRPDGEPIVTRAARLLPVLLHGKPAMLKLSFEEDERLGGAVMKRWDGDGAARVLARDEHALLLERTTMLDRSVRGVVLGRR